MAEPATASATAPAAEACTERVLRREQLLDGDCLQRVGAGVAELVEHDPGDLTCTVEAGVRLSALRDALAASGQRLSLDPPGDPTIVRAHQHAAGAHRKDALSAAGHTGGPSEHRDHRAEAG